MKIFKFVPYALFILILTVVSTTFGDPVLSLCSKYTLLQLGNNGGDSTSPGVAKGGAGDKLEITSNSSVFGSTLKGVDDKPEKNKITTSKVTGSWDRESGVTNEESSSWTGSQSTLTDTAFESIAANARAVSNYWAGQSGADITVNLNSATGTIDKLGDGANINVFNVTSGFILNSGAKLILKGDPGDTFVFNISEDRYFSMQSGSIIALEGGLAAEGVLYNVLGNIGDAVDDGTLIGGGSIFQGTLLAPGRKVEITQNHFNTFVSGGYMGTQAPLTTAITAADAITEKEANDSSRGGLWGQIVAGGAINFTESDISHHGFCVTPEGVPIVPEPSLGLLLGISLVGLVGVGAVRKLKQRKDK